MKSIPALPLVIMTFVLAGCNLQWAQPLQATGGPSAPTAWLDAPLDGMTIPLEPYEVIFHMADPAGVSLGELSVDGQVLASLPNPNGTDTPVTLRSTWIPPGPGLYTVRVRAQGSSGRWSEYALARVTVGTPTETPTPTLTATVTPTITSTPASSAITFTPELSTHEVFFGACQPNQVSVSVQLSNTSSVKHIELYLNLLDMNSSASSKWNSYSVMADGGNGRFTTTIQAGRIQGVDRFSSATVLYQFIAFGATGRPIARSINYNDLSLAACGGVIVPFGPTFLFVPVGPSITPTLIPPPK